MISSSMILTKPSILPGKLCTDAVQRRPSPSLPLGDRSGGGGGEACGRLRIEIDVTEFYVVMQHSTAIPAWGNVHLSASGNPAQVGPEGRVRPSTSSTPQL